MTTWWATGPERSSAARCSTAPPSPAWPATPPCTGWWPGGAQPFWTTAGPPAPLWSALVVRDRHCRFPGCDREPGWCEAHHVRHFAHGGATNLANLILA